MWPERLLRTHNRTASIAKEKSMPAEFQILDQTEKGRQKIRDIKVIVLQGPRSYTLVKVIAADGLYGIGEAYGSPGVGVKEQIEAIKPALIGRDPLAIDVLYTMMGKQPNCIGN